MENTVIKHRGGGNNQNAFKVRKFMYTRLPDGVHGFRWPVPQSSVTSKVISIDESVQVTVDMKIEEKTLHVLVETHKPSTICNIIDQLHSISHKFQRHFNNTQYSINTTSKLAKTH